MKNILVLCTGNSCRSQMAHGYLNQLATNFATIYSAGIETHGINPGAAAIMKEDGIDITNYTSNRIDDYAAIDFDFIITVCDHAKENCPFIASLMQSVCTIIFMTRLNLSEQSRKYMQHS